MSYLYCNNNNNNNNNDNNNNNNNNDDDDDDNNINNNTNNNNNKQFLINTYLKLSSPACNFQSMKGPVELNGLLSKFFCYIT